MCVIILVFIIDHQHHEHQYHHHHHHHHHDDQNQAWRPRSRFHLWCGRRADRGRERCVQWSQVWKVEHFGGFAYYHHPRLLYNFCSQILQLTWNQLLYTKPHCKISNHTIHPFPPQFKEKDLTGGVFTKCQTLICLDVVFSLTYFDLGVIVLRFSDLLADFGR